MDDHRWWCVGCGLERGLDAREAASTACPQCGFLGVQSLQPEMGGQTSGESNGINVAVPGPFVIRGPV
jgi:hypothetical protein